MAFKILLLFIVICCAVNASNIQKIPSTQDATNLIKNHFPGGFKSADVKINHGEQNVQQRLDLDMLVIIKKALDKVKELMLDKIELLDLPRLDPYEIAHQDIDFSHEIGVFKGSLDNVKLKNLSKYIVKDVEVAGRLPWNITFNLIFNNVDIFGDYDIDAMVGNIIHIFGKGPFNIIMNNLDVKIFLTNLTLKNTHVQFDDIAIKVKLGEMKSNLTNLMGGGEDEKVFNKLIEEMAPESVDEFWPDIEPIATKIFIEEGNKKLSKVTLYELLKLLGSNPPVTKNVVIT